MVSIKKGTGGTLQQLDISAAKVSGIVAGMYCNITGTTLAKGPKVGSGTSGVNGVALNDTGDSDVIASGKISLLIADGSSVIETDQITESSLSGYAVGAVVYACNSTHSTPGYFTATEATTTTDAVGICVGTAEYHAGAAGDGSTIGTAVTANGIKYPMKSKFIAVQLFPKGVVTAASV